jgi:excisionase family DNA binding protein
MEQNELFPLYEPIIGRLDALIMQIESLEKKVREISVGEDDLITVEQCASLLNLKRSTIYRMTSEDRIPHFKKGGRVYFSKEAVLIWLKDSQDPERRER